MDEKEKANEAKQPCPGQFFRSAACMCPTGEGRGDPGCHESQLDILVVAGPSTVL